MFFLSLRGQQRRLIFAWCCLTGHDLAIWWKRGNVILKNTSWFYCWRWFCFYCRCSSTVSFTLHFHIVFMSNPRWQTIFMLTTLFWDLCYLYSAYLIFSSCRVGQKSRSGWIVSVFVWRCLLLRRILFPLGVCLLLGRRFCLNPFGRRLLLICCSLRWIFE